MLKKFLTSLYIILFILLIYVFQIAIIDTRDLFGTRPNLILILVIVVSLWYGVYAGAIFGFTTGFVTDILFGSKFGGFTIAYTIIGLLIGYINGNYRKESKMSLVYVTIIATATFEIVQYIEYLVITGIGENVFYLLKQILLSVLLNVIIVFIVYSAVYKIVGYFDGKFRKEEF